MTKEESAAVDRPESPEAGPETGSETASASLLEAANDTPRRIIIVHGKDFKPPAEPYFELAVEAMVQGMRRDYPDEVGKFEAVPKSLCYYGDLSNRLLNYIGKHYDEVLDLGDRRNALAQLTLIQKRKHFSLTRYDRLPGKTATSEFAVDLLAPLLAALGMSTPILARLNKDVHAYWSDPEEHGEAVLQRVIDVLEAALEARENVLLVSHGFGAVVAYDALWMLSHHDRYRDRFGGRKIDTWITLGAPLGDLLVRRRLRGAKQKGRLRYPTNVVSWHNISAEDDHTSHDNTLADDFRPMLKQRLVSSIRDYRAYNMAVRYGRSDPHASVGYYIHPRFAQIVAEWLNAVPLSLP